MAGMGWRVVVGIEALDGCNRCKAACAPRRPRSGSGHRQRKNLFLMKRRVTMHSSDLCLAARSGEIPALGTYQHHLTLTYGRYTLYVRVPNSHVTFSRSRRELTRPLRDQRHARRRRVEGG